MVARYSERGFDSELMFPFLGVFPGSLGTRWKFLRAPSNAGVGSINIVDKVIQVPVSASVYDRNTRAHELAHGFLSRGEPLRLARAYNARFSTYQAMEDARMHHYLVDVSHIDISAGFVPRGRVLAAAQVAIERRAYRDLVVMAIAGHRTAQAEEVRCVLEHARDGGDLFAKLALEIADRAIAFLCAPARPTQQRTGQTARWLERRLKLLANENDKRESPDGTPGKVPTCAGDPPPGATTPSPYGDWTLGDDLDGEPLDIGEEFRNRFLTEYGGATTVSGRGVLSAASFTPWGTLTVEEPPLVEATERGRVKRWRTAREGWHMRSIDRLLIDGRVFGRRVRNDGGAVLIDVSGSMNMSRQRVWDIVCQVPGTVVAAYAGDGSSGLLRVLGRNGLVAGKGACENNFGKQNVVDLPALEWLAALHGPRVWISDGHVTGCDDGSGPENRRQVERLCKSASITRVTTVEEAVNLLRATARSRR